MDSASVCRIENWEKIFNNLTDAVRKNVVKYSIGAVFLDMYQLSRITPIEVFGLNKADIVVLVVEGYEDCGRALALVKKFDAKVVTVLNKHERDIEYPGATIKIPFSATLDYYNRRVQLYTNPVTKLAEYLLQELKRVTRSRWFE